MQGRLVKREINLRTMHRLTVAVPVVILEDPDLEGETIMTLTIIGGKVDTRTVGLEILGQDNIMQTVLEVDSDFSWVGGGWTSF